MCGIAGFKARVPDANSVLRGMVASLVHRGPDSDGYFFDEGYAAGMRRLAINDLACGDQPLYSPDRQVVLIYNGEIYNYPELRRELEAKGHHFRTHSDGEVICHLYQYHGENLFERLDGMFAAALWIIPERKLILARDLPGEKPLYYAEGAPGEIVFASEIGALKRYPGLPLSLNRQAIWDFPTFLWIPEPATIYREVKALPRGHILTVQDGRTQLRAYENRFNRRALASRRGESVVAETRHVVESAIKSRLLSDVPVGSFLSGGLDSSIVATIAMRELGSLDTFSVGFDDMSDPYHGRSDETADAAATARWMGSRHHIIRVTAKSFRAELDTFCRHGGQPYAVSSGLGILAVAKAARDANIKVLLSGDGADEAFGGYTWYAYLNAASRDCGAPHLNGVSSFQNFGDPISKRLAAIDAMPSHHQAWAWHYYAHEDEKLSLFADGLGDGLTSSVRHFEDFDRKTKWRPIDFITQDREFYFPNEMLSKVDRMTMAYSVEGRVPFAAPSVLSHADKLDFDHFIASDGQLKTVLRQAFADILPSQVVGRPKHGFNVPIDHWLREEWADLVEETFSAESALHRHGICSRNANEVAQAMLRDPRRLNGHTVFCMIMLNRWLEQEAHGNHR